MPAIKKHQPEPDARHDRRRFDQSDLKSIFAGEIVSMVVCLAGVALVLAAVKGKLDGVARLVFGW